MDLLIQLLSFLVTLTLFVYFKYRKLSEVVCIITCIAAALSATMMLLPFVSWMNFNEGVGITMFFLVLMTTGFLITVITEWILKLKK